MASKELVVLVILLNCLLVVQQINQAITMDYRRLHDQRRLLLTQVMAQKTPQKRKKTKAILDKTRENTFVGGISTNTCACRKSRLSPPIFGLKRFRVNSKKREQKRFEFESNVSVFVSIVSV